MEKPILHWLKGNAQHNKISSFYGARLRCQELGGNPRFNDNGQHYTFKAFFSIHES